MSTTSPADQANPDNPVTPASEAPSRRVLIIGLDGATFDVLDPMMAAGRMPNLARFLESGVGGVLRSTKPPITPAAWTTFMTGKGPGRHGIIDFERYHVSEHKVTFNSTYEIREKTLWEHLSDKGLRVGAINVPMTYPPRPVKGFMISGFETPSIDAEFTYPPELKRDILAAIPDYNYRTNWRRTPLGGLDTLTTNLDYINNSFEQGFRLVELCGEKYGWDVLMLVYKLVDNLQHKAWKYLDPRYQHKYPTESRLAAECFQKLDEALGRLFAYARSHEATVVIMSDHGHGSLDGKAQPNLLLKRWGYLKLRSPMQQMSQRATYWMHRLTKGKATRFEQGARGVERELAVDWDRTQACVMHAGIYGFLYLCVKGRGPIGTVDPADYERMRDEIASRLRAERIRWPDGSQTPIFPEIYKPEDIYGCNREDYPDLPDLLLSPAPGLAVIRKIRGRSPVRWSSESRLEGTHRIEGVMAFAGPGVRPGPRFEADIADITPTVLAALGLPVPIDMEGRVLHEVFDRELTIEREPPVVKQREAHDEVYSQRERELLEKRLSELGYLE